MFLLWGLGGPWRDPPGLEVITPLASGDHAKVLVRWLSRLWGFTGDRDATGTSSKTRKTQQLAGQMFYVVGPNG